VRDTRRDARRLASGSWRVQFDAELLLDGHDQFYDVERVSPKIVGKAVLRRHRRRGHTELLPDPFSEAFLNAGNVWPFPAKSRLDQTGQARGAQPNGNEASIGAPEERAATQT